MASDRFAALAEIVAGVAPEIRGILAAWLAGCIPVGDRDRFLRACGVGKEQERG